MRVSHSLVQRSQISGLKVLAVPIKIWEITRWGRKGFFDIQRQEGSIAAKAASLANLPFRGVGWGDDVFVFILNATANPVFPAAGSIKLNRGKSRLVRVSAATVKSMAQFPHQHVK